MGRCVRSALRPDKEREREKVMGMLRSTAIKIAWVGRTASMVFGLALVLALVVGVASTALGANGQNFILGKLNNAATSVTGLVGNVNGAAMKVSNPNAGADDTALSLSVQAGEAPMRVNSGVRVANLNAARAGIADSAVSAANAQNADKVDGRHATDLIRVASAKSVNNSRVDTSGVVLTTSISAPTAGFLVIDASSDVFRFSSTVGFPTCFIRVDGTFDIASERAMRLDAGSNTEEDCATNTVIPVAAGEHTVNLEAEFMTSGTTFDESTLSALFVPFDGSGQGPATAAIASTEEAKEVSEEGSQPNR